MKFKMEMWDKSADSGSSIAIRLSDYAVDDQILGHEGEPSPNGPSVTIINILDVVRRVRAWRMCCKYDFSVVCIRYDIAETPVSKGFRIKKNGAILFE